MRWLENYYRRKFEEQALADSCSRTLELSFEHSRKRAADRMEKATVPWEQTVLRKYAKAIHLQPTSHAEYNPRWDQLTALGVPTEPFTLYTFWRALPCEGFEPQTFGERQRCPKEATKLEAYKARLRILMKDDSYGDGVIEQVMRYLDTRREKAAVEKAQREAQAREEKLQTARQIARLLSRPYPSAGVVDRNYVVEMRRRYGY